MDFSIGKGCQYGKRVEKTRHDKAKRRKFASNEAAMARSGTLDNFYILSKFCNQRFAQFRSAFTLVMIKGEYPVSNNNNS